jgi:hypothetical protein
MILCGSSLPDKHSGADAHAGGGSHDHHSVARVIFFSFVTDRFDMIYDAYQPNMYLNYEGTPIGYGKWHTRIPFIGFFLLTFYTLSQHRTWLAKLVLMLISSTHFM